VSPTRGSALGPAGGVVAELDDGHDVQDPVDAPVPEPGRPPILLSSRYLRELSLVAVAPLFGRSRRGGDITSRFQQGLDDLRRHGTLVATSSGWRIA
jgi:hypothetical protein